MATSKKVRLKVRDYDTWDCPHCAKSDYTNVPYEREFEDNPRIVFCRHCRKKVAVQRVSYLIAGAVE